MHSTGNSKEQITPILILFPFRLDFLFQLDFPFRLDFHSFFSPPSLDFFLSSLNL